MIMRGRLSLALVIAFIWIMPASSAAKALAIEDQSAGDTIGPIVKNLAVSAKLDQQVVDIGAPVVVTLALKNFGPPICLSRFHAFIDYELAGTGPDGSPIAKTHEPGFSGSVPSCWNIGTGDALENTRDLNKLYDFRMPGRYKFWFQTTAQLEYQWDVAYAILRSNILVLDVKYPWTF
jgi:hypothetical protein